MEPDQSTLVTTDHGLIELCTGLGSHAFYQNKRATVLLYHRRFHFHKQYRENANVDVFLSAQMMCGCEYMRNFI